MEFESTPDSYCEGLCKKVYIFVSSYVLSVKKQKSGHIVLCGCGTKSSDLNIHGFISDSVPICFMNLYFISFSTVVALTQSDMCQGVFFLKIDSFLKNTILSGSSCTVGFIPLSFLPSVQIYSSWSLLIDLSIVQSVTPHPHLLPICFSIGLFLAFSIIPVLFFTLTLFLVLFKVLVSMIFISTAFQSHVLF